MSMWPGSVPVVTIPRLASEPQSARASRTPPLRRPTRPPAAVIEVAIAEARARAPHGGFAGVPFRLVSRRLPLSHRNAALDTNGMEEEDVPH
jgi:hypothetical protein